jgi:hypothetical protein
VTGYTSSNNGNITGNHGPDDSWVAKLDSGGSIEWQRCLGGTQEDVTFNVQLTRDGGYILAGNTWSNDGDVSGNHGNCDFLIFKITSTGFIQWQKSLGGTRPDYGTSVTQTKDGGFIFSGYTLSNDGDVSGNHGLYDAWVGKLDSAGILLWQKCLGGIENDYAYSILQTRGGSYTVAGATRSNDGDVSGNHGDRDSWIVNLDTVGVINWQVCIGGGFDEEAYSIHQTNDGGYIVGGFSNSNDGDVSGNNGGYDFWIVKLSTDSTIGIEELTQKDLSLSPSPAHDFIHIISNSNHLLNGTFEICNIHGQICSTGSLQHEMISVAELSAQMYFVRIITPQGVFVEKFLKE